MLTIYTLIPIAHVVRTSQLCNISLRHNRISPTDTVALALMIKDYPDTLPSGSSSSLSLSPYPFSQPGSPQLYYHLPVAHAECGVAG
jgi:protein phosphatase 1 regulatory subunit 37